MEQTGAEKESTEGRQESLLTSFTRADIRLFLITFAGTVARTSSP
jgi:hypothetical protein